MEEILDHVRQKRHGNEFTKRHKASIRGLVQNHLLIMWAMYRAQIIFTPPQVRKVACTVLTQYEGAVLLNIFSFSEFSGSTFKKNLERTNCVSQKITPAASLMISTMNGCEKKELEEVISFTSVAIDSIKTLLFLSSARWCVRAFVARAA